MTNGRIQKVTALLTPDGATYRIVEEQVARRSFGGRFHVVFDGPLAERVDKLKTFSAFKVFHHLPQFLTFSEFRHLNQSELAASLGIGAASVSRGMQELLNCGIIERKGKGSYAQWRLSMEWGWRGSVGSFHKAKRDRQEKRPKLTVVSSSGPSAAA